MKKYQKVLDNVFKIVYNVIVTKKSIGKNGVIQMNTVREEILKIRDDWTVATRDCTERYKKVLEDTFKRLGLYGVDVYSTHTGKKGRLALKKHNLYGVSISWDVVLIPYKKDGTFSERAEALNAFTFSDTFEEDLLKAVTRVGDTE